MDRCRPRTQADHGGHPPVGSGGSGLPERSTTLRQAERAHRARQGAFPCHDGHPERRCRAVRAVHGQRGVPPLADGYGVQVDLRIRALAPFSSDFIDGIARHMRDALPNPSFIGFTGTPIEADDANTPAVFGHYIDIYDISRAVVSTEIVDILQAAGLRSPDIFIFSDEFLAEVQQMEKKNLAL